MTIEGKQRNPELRTQEFFSQDVESLAQAMQAMLIRSPYGSVQIREVKVYPKEENQAQKYHLTQELDPGHFITVFVNANHISLITAYDGSCLHITKAAKWNEEKQQFESLTRLSDLLTALGIGPVGPIELKKVKEEGIRLKFRDDTDTLYIDIADYSQAPKIQTDSAEPLNNSDRYFGGLLSDDD